MPAVVAMREGRDEEAGASCLGLHPAGENVTARRSHHELGGDEGLEAEAGHPITALLRACSELSHRLAKLADVPPLVNSSLVKETLLALS